ncbi:fibronectin type III-like domain-contianing protein [Streptomyces sp. NPDC029003]|uniref:fibronectin type III-like domain-contianing protein n=1 Tax=Streptomyces sp. NPDC029003 TaxID=3155125 RepID=UPI0033E96A73
MAQVCVGQAAELWAERPARALAGYRRLVLAPGESHRVTRTLSSWDPGRQAWVPGSGLREVFAGRSSRELPLPGKAVVRSG